MVALRLVSFVNISANIMSEVQRMHAQEEWLPLKLCLTNQRYSPARIVYKQLLSLENDDYKNISILIEIMLVLSLSTAEEERGVSKLNVIKDTLSTNLDDETLDDLMEISINGPTMANFDSSESIDWWLNATSGTRHVHGHNSHKVSASVKPLEEIIELL